MQAANTTIPQKISTNELAAALRLATQTIRVGLHANKGEHYLGLRPVKLPNGRLLWDAAEVEALVSGSLSK